MKKLGAASYVNDTRKPKPPPAWEPVLAQQKKSSSSLSPTSRLYTTNVSTSSLKDLVEKKSPNSSKRTSPVVSNHKTSAMRSSYPKTHREPRQIEFLPYQGVKAVAIRHCRLVL